MSNETNGPVHTQATHAGNAYLSNTYQNKAVVKFPQNEDDDGYFISMDGQHLLHQSWRGYANPA